MNNEINDVATFSSKFGMIVNDKPTLNKELIQYADQRFEFVLEELDELFEGIENSDLPAIADALIDTVYILKGLAASFGLPWDELWADVHRANMSKAITNDVEGYKFGVGKPDGWVGPRTNEILEENGWNG